MCGICGVISKKKVDENSLIKMIDSISYRGPNDKGVYIDKIEDSWVGMAQCRLSILDLSKNGHQPMKNGRDDIIIVYNGEVYNFQAIRKELITYGYSFSSTSDTEVILYAYEKWGINCVKKFNGMFAFALLDKTNKVFYLVRDRVGVKPLYYYYRNDQLIFGSEIKPIMQSMLFEKDINVDNLAYYLANQYLHEDRTIFNNTFKLLPGEMLKWDKNGISTEKYWEIENVIKNSQQFEGSFEEAKKELKDLLLDSCSLRLISDVPIGAFLSNGVDSSLITSLLCEVSSSKIDTFTIGFEENEYNEANYAKKVAQYLGTAHHEEYISQEVCKKQISSIARYFDEPMADSSSLATMIVSRIAKQDVTVAISGDAGDELFCGYNKYVQFENFRKYSSISKMINNKYLYPVVKSFKKCDKKNVSKLFYMRTDDEIVQATQLSNYERTNRLIKTNVRECKKIIIPDYIRNIKDMAMYVDIKTYLPDDILTKVDRSSMSCSLETRAPFLDYRVVEMALSLPLSYKSSNGINKRILRSILFDYIPENLIYRGKKGFGIPYKEWMYTNFSDYSRDYFTREYIDKQGLFDYNEVRRLIDIFYKQPKSIYGKDLWTLLVFQIWYDYYIRN